MDLLSSLANDMIDTLDPVRWLKRIGFEPYPWQIFVLNSIKQGHKRIVINGARQAGKSTITAGIPAYISKQEKALSLIYAPSDEQSKDDIDRVKDFIYRDDTYPNLVLDSMEHIRLPNGAIVKANTASPKTKRGKSMPRALIFDEAAYIDDRLYKTVRPMLTKNHDCIVIGISTGNGKTGWYYNAFQSQRWLKVMVRAPWDIIDGDIAPAEPEKAYQKRMEQQGIHAFYSPRHDEKEFMEEELEAHGERWFRQEYLCEFVEPEDQVFDYDDIRKMFDSGDNIEPLDMGLTEGKTSALFL